MLKRPEARIIRVKKAYYLTPNMIRVTFSGPELKGIPSGREGGNCKLTIPFDGQNYQAFVEQMQQGKKLPVRTYTVRAYREKKLEMDIDFVAHGTEGPASRWAMTAKPGSFCGFRGPSTAKVTHFESDWYVIAADMSALPLAVVTLESMPRDAKGVAVFEVATEADKQLINAPKGVGIYWLINANSHVQSHKQEVFIRKLKWPIKRRVQACVAGESGVIKSL